MKKKLLIVANWKMNQSKKDAVDFVKELVKESENFKNQIIISPSFTLLEALRPKLAKSKIKLAGQNVFFADFGAFTGEVSAPMLKDVGAEYVILGHSERRQYFLELNSLINKKVITSLKYNLKPIICVGETLEQKEDGEAKEVIKEQILGALQGVEEKQLSNIIIAYEPVWAIGSGQSASSEYAYDMAKYINEVIKDYYDTSFEVAVLYGGSVNGDNASEFFEKKYISGALIGSASLNLESFLKIVKS